MGIDITERIDKQNTVIQFQMVIFTLIWRSNIFSERWNEANDLAEKSHP